MPWGKITFTIFLASWFVALACIENKKALAWAMRAMMVAGFLWLTALVWMQP